MGRRVAGALLVVGWLTGGAGEGVPAAVAVVGDVVDEGEVLVDGPRAAPELQLLLLILRRPSGLAVVVVELNRSPRRASPAPAPAPLGFGHVRCSLMNQLERERESVGI